MFYSEIANNNSSFIMNIVFVSCANIIIIKLDFATLSILYNVIILNVFVYEIYTFKSNFLTTRFITLRNV